MTATPAAAGADRAFLVHLAESAGSTGPVSSGPRHFDARSSRIEFVEGVWPSAAACYERLDRLAMDHPLGAC